jgi:hypothetical protein
VPAAHDGPWPCVLASMCSHMRPRHGGLVTARHLMPALSVDHPPPALPASMCATPLSSSRVGYSIEAKFTCFSSHNRSRSALTRASLCTPPHRSLPTAPGTAIAVVHEHQSSTIMSCHHPQVKPPVNATV